VDEYYQSMYDNEDITDSESSGYYSDSTMPSLANSDSFFDSDNESEETSDSDYYSSEDEWEADNDELAYGIPTIKVVLLLRGAPMNEANSFKCTLQLRGRTKLEVKNGF